MKSIFDLWVPGLALAAKIAEMDSRDKEERYGKTAWQIVNVSLEEFKFREGDTTFYASRFRVSWISNVTSAET
jgi:hypothetical protein